MLHKWLVFHDVKYILLQDIILYTWNDVKYIVLELTKDVDTTISNILEGRVVYTAEVEQKTASHCQSSTLLPDKVRYIDQQIKIVFINVMSIIFYIFIKKSLL